MTYSAEEAEKAAMELLELTLKANETNSRIKTLKAELLEYADIENINEKVWVGDNGYVEVKTEVKQKLVDIPADTKVDANVCPIDIAEKAFKSKIVLTKEGKKMLLEEYPTIVKLVDKTEKKAIKVTT